MSKKVLTTVGISIFENCNKISNCKDFKEILKELKNDAHSFAQIKSISVNDIEDLKSETRKWSIANNNASAEIRSILEIAKETTDIRVHLLATDTALSVFAAELIKEWFEKFKPDITVAFEQPAKLTSQKDSNYIIHKLQVNSNKDYQEGFMNLIDVVSKLIEKDKTILNITGGYKAIIPIMTLIGQVKSVPLKYIYEESDLDTHTELVEIGDLPFSFDWEIGELYLDDLSSDGLKVIAQKPLVLKKLRDLSLIQPNKYKRTPMGELFKSHLEDRLTTKKSTLGYLIELKVFKHFLQQNRKVSQGKEFWWNVLKPSKFSTEAQFGQDKKKEKRIDIDIFINESTETWHEVKSMSKTGLNKATKQLATMLDFIEKTNYLNVSTIGLILYKLSSTDYNRYVRQLNNIKQLFLNQSIKLTIYYFDIPETEKGQFNTKRFFERDITLNSLTI